LEGVVLVGGGIALGRDLELPVPAEVVPLMVLALMEQAEVVVLLLTKLHPLMMAVVES
jgi:hypothetical protein